MPFAKDLLQTFVDGFASIPDVTALFVATHDCTQEEKTEKEAEVHTFTAEMFHAIPAMKTQFYLARIA